MSPPVSLAVIGRHPAHMRCRRVTAWFLGLATLLCHTPASSRAQARPDSTVRLTVQLDHPNWLYRMGDSVTATVSVMRGERPLLGVPVVVTSGPERMRATRTDTVRATASGFTIRNALSAPGFLRITATARVEGRTLSAMATAGVDVDRLAPVTPMPDDFLPFWRQAIAEARRVPLDPVLTRRADLSTPDVDVYHVSFQNHKVGSRLYGMLSIPTRPGRYPATLVVPGAGVRPYFPNVAFAARGVIHLTIGIHGIPVDRDSLLYNELRATALAGYSTFGADDRDTYYYKRVFVGVVRAGDFIFSLPQFNGTQYIVQGGSQGGALSLVAGVLDPRVQGVVVTHPAMGDQWAPLSGRAGGWPHLFGDTSGMKAFAEKKATVPYFDAANFARLLRVPGIYSWGYNDLTVAPTSMYALYNVIAAPKELFTIPEIGHVRVPQQVTRMDAWILRQFGLSTP